jgi:hypothetical protein
MNIRIGSLFMIRKKNLAAASKFVVVSACLIFLVLFFYFLPVSYQDWMKSFFGSASNLAEPYGPNAFNPPWLYVLIHPLTWFGEKLGVCLLMVITLAILCLYLREPAKVFAIGISAPLIVLFSLGQIDGLVLLGFLVPAEFAPVLFMMKPQGIALACLRRISKRSIAIGATFLLLSFIIWGNWIMNASRFRHLAGGSQNVSFFPYLVPLGLWLAYQGVRKQSDPLLCGASLCISPYFMITSMLPLTATIINETDDKRIWALVVTVGWIYFFITKFMV